MRTLGPAEGRRGWGARGLVTVAIREFPEGRKFARQTDVVGTQVSPVGRSVQGQRAVRRLPEGKVCACVCVRVRPAEGEEEDANRTPRRCHGDRRRRGGPATSRCPQPWAGLPRRVLEQCPARIHLAGRGSRSASGDCPRGAATVPSRGRPHARLGPRLFPPRGHRPGRISAHSESLVSP